MNKKLRIALIAGAAAVIIGAGTGTALALTGGSAPTVHTLPQPEDAAQVAVSLGATGFHGETGGQVVGVQTGGSATYHGRKIGIDTFANGQVRDQWVQMSANFGISPLFEGSNWVAYWSVTT